MLVFPQKKSNETELIAICSYGFSNWGGGIDFIRNISYSISTIEQNSSTSKLLFLPRNDFTHYVKALLEPAKQMVRMLLNGQKPTWKPWQGFSEDYLKSTFSDLSTDFTICFAGSRYASQLAEIQKSGAEVVLPCIQPPPDKFPVPWVGYIYDFQHRHLPDLFTDSERRYRDSAFAEMLKKAKHVIVNAKSVISDAEHFIGEFPAELHALPFSPCPQRAWLEDENDVREKYGINKPYFMICNQFWKHKDHATAFRGFASYIAQGGDALLVCTGSTSDYRFPNYFTELETLIVTLGIKERIIILGHIPKMDQIDLVKHTLMMVQPTLFEGGPGGGAAYDAIALGIPVLASDIPVNLEMNCGDVRYFSTGDAEGLAKAMLQRDISPTTRPSNQQLWEEGLLRKRRCGQTLLRIAHQTVADFTKAR